MLFSRVNDLVPMRCTHGTPAGVEVDDPVSGHAIAPAHQNQLITFGTSSHERSAPGGEFMNVDTGAPAVGGDVADEFARAHDGHCTRYVERNTAGAARGFLAEGAIQLRCAPRVRRTHAPVTPKA